MSKPFHVIVPQFAICSDLTYPQLLKAAQLCCGENEQLLAITCQNDVDDICEYANWLTGKQTGVLKRNTICGECSRFVKSGLEPIDHKEASIGEVLQMGNVDFNKIGFPTTPTRENVADFIEQHLIYREIVLSSIATEFKLSSDFSVHDLQDIEFETLVRDLRAAINCYWSFRSLFSASNVRSVHLWNGRFLVHRSVLRAALHSGIPTFVYERGSGALPILIMNESATYQQVEFAKAVDRGLFPFSFQEAFNLRRDFLLNKALGFTYYAFTGYPDEAHLRRILSRSKGRKIVSLFTSSDYEFLEYQGLEWDRTGVLFKAQQELMDWYSATVKKYPDIFFTIRIHPNEGKRSLSKRVPISPFARKLMDQFAYFPGDNIEVIDPNDPLSAYSLLSVSSMSLTYASSVGLEAAQLGIPSIVVGDAYYRSTCAICPGSIEELEDLVSGKSSITMLLLLTNAARAWIIDASASVFAVWRKSGLKVRSYERGITPIYDSSNLSDGFLEFAPHKMLNLANIGRQDITKPRIVFPDDLEWCKQLASYESVDHNDLKALTRFLAEFWNGLLGVPTPDESVQRMTWKYLDIQGEPIPPPVISKIPGLLKRKVTILWISLIDCWKYRESRNFILTNLRIAGKVAIANMKSRIQTLLHF